MLSLPEKGVCQHLLEKGSVDLDMLLLTARGYKRDLLWTMSHIVHHRGTEGLTFNRHVREYGFECKYLTEDLGETSIARLSEQLFKC